ncbi:SLAM family member 7-like isoform X2 [Pangasianodon hypophthalmus]|uniref:SLAM family member 7-like isoform X2 n=1 Tax=Pangasianodon hypophthalmus TaxID=310915 RepID=UPI002307A38B|nr:SLAM family member 7-like isoform X2 [Pangasianodon hypophthalmus]
MNESLSFTSQVRLIHTSHITADKMKPRLYSKPRPRFLHHSLRLLLLFLSEIFSSVGGSSGQELLGAVGESVTFPIRVPVTGTISYKGNTVGYVFNKQSDTNVIEKFMNRLHWVSQIRFFTISHLRTDDSGLYTVESTKELKGKQDYQLEVYDRVSAPRVMKAASSSSEFCSLLCSVRNVRGLKLSLYKDDVLLNHTSSNNTSNITLNLHLEIKKTDNQRGRTFSCVASNPVSKESTPINITQYCSLDTEDDVSPPRSSVPIAVICSVISVLAIIVMFVCLWKRKQKESTQLTEDSSATEGLNEEIQYSVINHKIPLRKIHEILSVRTTAVYEQVCMQ